MINKECWNIEEYIKMIKQKLKIKSFVGTSENAVQIQIWTALITILLLDYVKMKAQSKWHMTNLINFIRLNLFVKIDLWAWINEPFISPNFNKMEQLLLFDGDGCFESQQNDNLFIWLSKEIVRNEIYFGQL